VQGRKALSHAFDKEEHGLSSDQMLFLKLQSVDFHPKVSHFRG
jgi:hypothetical protein